MKKIKEIRIKNFKAFPDEEVFKLDGKNLLLFGENGAGKSSLYWAIHVFLQSSEKNDSGVNKYFENYNPSDETTFQSLLNIHSFHGSADSFIKLVFNDGSVELSKDNGTNTRIADIKDANQASDFITYKLLYNFYESTHKTYLNVWEVLLKDIFPFFSYDSKSFAQHYSNFYTNKAQYTNGQYYRRNSYDYISYQNKIERFSIELDSLLGRINRAANSLLEEYFGVKNIKIKLSYLKQFAWDVNKNRSFTKPHIKFHIEILRNGIFVEQHRPQSFLNEAVLTQLALAIRLGALFTRLEQSDRKILVLDDLLISLDMDNREKVMDVLLQTTTKSGQPNKFDDFQILFFTHDRGLNYFVGEKIKQHGRKDEWLTQEIYAGIHEEKDSDGNILKTYPKPILIDGDLSDIEKAKRYLKINKDYTASALYVRKALEKEVIKRLPKEYINTSDGKPRELNVLWRDFVKYYSKMGGAIPDNLKNIYDQSRLMVLNPQVHHNLSFPLYKQELIKAIKLIEELSLIPITKFILLLVSGTRLIFRYLYRNRHKLKLCLNYVSSYF